MRPASSFLLGLGSPVQSALQPCLPDTQVPPNLDGGIFRTSAESSAVMLPKNRISTSCAILEANEALLDIVDYSRGDLVSGGLRWTDLTPPEWRDRDEQALGDLKAYGSAQPYEKECIRKDGSPRA